MKRLCGILLCSRWLWFAALALALTIIFGLGHAGRFVSEADDAIPAKADLIVSLGGESGMRIRRAYQLYAVGYAPRLLLTGIQDAGGTQPSAQDWRITFLSEQGVPRQAVMLDDRSENTWQEAVNTRRLMEKNGWSKVLVVSDPPHMRRLSWVWHKVFGEGPVTYSLVAASSPGWDADRWWSHEASAEYVLKELLKLGYYRVVY